MEPKGLPKCYLEVCCGNSMSYCSVSFSIVVKTVGLCKWLLFFLWKSYRWNLGILFRKKNFREVDAFGGLYSFHEDLYMEHLHVSELECHLGRPEPQSRKNGSRGPMVSGWHHSWGYRPLVWWSEASSRLTKWGRQQGMHQDHRTWHCSPVRQYFHLSWQNPMSPSP